MGKYRSQLTLAIASGFKSTPPHLLQPYSSPKTASDKVSSQSKHDSGAATEKEHNAVEDQDMSEGAQLVVIEEESLIVPVGKVKVTPKKLADKPVVLQTKKEGEKAFFKKGNPKANKKRAPVDDSDLVPVEPMELDNPVEEIKQGEAKGILGMRRHSDRERESKELSPLQVSLDRLNKRQDEEASDKSDINLEDEDDAEYEFRDYVWPGGEKVVKGEPDEYKDVSPSVV